VAECLPWLRQGDVFEDVPFFVPAHAGDALIIPVGDGGAAVLITENCQLDKRTNSGRPRPGQRLQFLPLRDIAALGDDRMRRLIERADNPPEAIYVLPYEDTHLVGLLGEAYSIPATWFGARSEDFTGHVEADPDDPFHLVVEERHYRVGTMEPADIELMYRKMSLYWTGDERVQAEPIERPPDTLPGI
jgi:hypothetical protein